MLRRLLAALQLDIGVSLDDSMSMVPHITAVCVSFLRNFCYTRYHEISVISFIDQESFDAQPSKRVFTFLNVARVMQPMWAILADT